MNMKNKKKFLKIISIVFIIILSYTTISNGFSITDLTGTETDKFDNIGILILRYFSIVGSGLSIILLIILGIKYMLGSLEEKANYKATMLPYFVGALFVFGASTIAGLIYTVVNPAIK